MEILAPVPNVLMILIVNHARIVNHIADVIEGDVYKGVYALDMKRVLNCVIIQVLIQKKIG